MTILTVYRSVHLVWHWASNIVIFLRLSRAAQRCTNVRSRIYRRLPYQYHQHKGSLPEFTTPSSKFHPPSPLPFLIIVNQVNVYAIRYHCTFKPSRYTQYYSPPCRHSCLFFKLSDYAQYHCLPRHFSLPHCFHLNLTFSSTTSPPHINNYCYFPNTSLFHIAPFFITFFSTTTSPSFHTQETSHKSHHVLKSHTIGSMC